MADLEPPETAWRRRPTAQELPDVGRTAGAQNKGSKVVPVAELAEGACQGDLGLPLYKIEAKLKLQEVAQLAKATDVLHRVVVH